MDDFLRKLVTEIRRLNFETDGPLVVGASGGADSSALLAALAELKAKNKIDNGLIAAHYNHKTRENESDEEENFVRLFANEIGVDFKSGSFEMGKIEGNPEQAWRDSRYSFLLDVAKEYGSNVVVTGHTLDDQSETFLMNMMRGSGTKGLTAMSAVRGLKPETDVKLVRPLLGWATRADTEGFCRTRGIAFRCDPMNDDKTFTRIRIRKELIPLMREFNPKIVSSLAKTAEHLGDMEDANRILIHQNPDLLAMIRSETLEVSELNAMHPGLRRIVVRLWIARRQGSLRRLGFEHIESVIRLSKGGKSGKVVELPGEFIVIKERGHISLREAKVEKTHGGVYN